MAKSVIPEVLRQHEKEIVDAWVADLRTQVTVRDRDIGETCHRFVDFLKRATAEGEASITSSVPYAEMREMLTDLSKSQTRLGATPRETATFVYSFKKPFFLYLGRFLSDARQLAEEVWLATELIDSLGLYTTDAAAKAREEVIARQHEEMLELSTPVVKLWEGILALPVIGTLDSQRTQVVMETLLSRISETGATTAIIDITGVPTVDTLTAQHLIKTVTAARLMGADCIISGIRPQIAQTIVHLGVDLGDITTKATLADAFQLALRQKGFGFAKFGSRAANDLPNLRKQQD